MVHRKSFIINTRWKGGQEVPFITEDKDGQKKEMTHKLCTQPGATRRRSRSK